MTIFEKIIARELPSEIIYEDERVIAFLTIQPFAKGHTLVVPKKPVDQLWDLDEDEYSNLMSVAKKIALHIRETMRVARVGMVVKGFDIPHVHVHLVPLSVRGATMLDVVDPSFADPEELAEIAKQIRMI